MNAHTPGPWHSGHEDLRGGRYWVVTIPGIGDSVDLHEDDNGEANCRLIAAAPDMFLALNRALGLLVIDGDPPALAAIEDLEESAVIEVYELISAAIAKANGAAS